MPSQDRTQTLVLDTAPLLTSSLSSLLRFSNRFVTTNDVIAEVRGKGQRERLEQEWKTLDATLNIATSQADDHRTGLHIREPSVDGIRKIKEFATKTGDIAVLSTTDIRLLALAYDVEVEANGTWRLRETIGAKRMGKDPEKKKARLLRKQQAEQSNQQNTSDIEPPIENAVSSISQQVSCDGDSSSSLAPQNRCSLPSPGGSSEVFNQLATQTDLLSLGTISSKPTSISESDQETNQQEPMEPRSTAEPEMEHMNAIDASSDADWEQVPIKISTKTSEVDDECSDSSSFVSVSDPSWITPENVHIHQATDMGLFPSLGPKPGIAQSNASATGPAENHDHATRVTNSTTGEGSAKPPTMKAAILTGDFAMQNVALQIGLNVLGVGGKRIRDVKTWILRCYGCFKLCKEPTRKFCPTCGGATLTRVSITYTPSSPTGYILHLNPKFQYRNRGTVYSIPSPKPGSASFEKGGAKKNKSINGATLVLREDQKEFQQGLKALSIQKQKEERKLKKATESTSTPLSPFGGAMNDPDWEPPMLMGEKGRKGNSRSSYHHLNQAVRYGKDGLPLIGFGKNPNEVRRRGKR